MRLEGAIKYRLLSILLLFFILFTNTVVYAEDILSIGGVANFATNSVTGGTTLVTALAYMIGIGLATVGMFKFKAHKDMPHQNKLSDAIVLIAVGAGLIWLPKTLESVQGTLFNDDPGDHVIGPGGRPNLFTPP